MNQLIIKYIYIHNKKITNFLFSKIIILTIQTWKQEYKNYTTEPLLLSNKEISRIKSKVIGKFKNLGILEIIEKIRTENLNIVSYSIDLKYTISLKKNKLIDRTEKIIIFATKEGIKLLNNINCFEFLIDITFDVVPKKFKPLKFMSIATVDFSKYKTYIICFIFLKYLDSIFY
jgi:hypothetical protein